MWRIREHDPSRYFFVSRSLTIRRDDVMMTKINVSMSKIGIKKHSTKFKNKNSISIFHCLLHAFTLLIPSHPIHYALKVFEYSWISISMSSTSTIDDRLKRRTGAGVGRNNQTNDSTTIGNNFSAHNNNNNTNSSSSSSNISLIHQTPPSTTTTTTTTTRPSAWRRRRKSRATSSSLSSSWKDRISVASLKRYARILKQQDMPRRLTFLVLVVIVIAASFLLFESYSAVIGSSPAGNLRRQQLQAAAAADDDDDEIMIDFYISFQNNNNNKAASVAVSQPARLLNKHENETNGEYIYYDVINLDYRDYDDIEDYAEFDFKNNYERVARPRHIFQYDYLLATEYRDPDTPPDDDSDAYYALDDDFLKAKDGVSSVSVHNPVQGQVCRRTSAHRQNYQNCNTMFETSFIYAENNVKYINEGSYRQVFGLQHSFEEQHEQIVIKKMYSSVDFKQGDFEYVRMDAMVADRLTSSPRIYDIYGFCGMAIMSEFFPYGDYEDVAVPGSGYLLTEKEQIYQETHELKSYNSITSTDKLRISLQMAEALADLHGDPMGIIVHQDVQLSQYLLSADGQTVKLNDFNRAEFMLWDENKGKYCKYGEGHGAGNWRSPEEYFDNNLDEKVDVFSLGNNIYSVLTGLWVFYDEDDYWKMQHRLMDGEKAYIDPRYKERSLAEAKLVYIIDQCHEFDPEKRPSIFEVVEFLREAMEEVDEII